MTYTLTSKAQVTLPKTIREHLRVAPGDAVQFRIVADGSVRVEPAQAPDAAQAKQLADARARLRKLKGSGGSAQIGTDALMRLLRGHDDDAADPGFAAAPAAPAKAANTARRPRRT